MAEFNSSRLVLPVSASLHWEVLPVRSDMHINFLKHDEFLSLIFIYILISVHMQHIDRLPDRDKVSLGVAETAG